MTGAYMSIFGQELQKSKGGRRSTYTAIFGFSVLLSIIISLLFEFYLLEVGMWGSAFFLSSTTAAGLLCLLVGGFAASSELKNAAFQSKWLLVIVFSLTLGYLAIISGQNLGESPLSPDFMIFWALPS